MGYQTFYRTIQIDSRSIFYREAGRRDAPTVLLLHGLPSSSRIFEPLFSRLSDQFHLFAADYPGFGHRGWPDPKQFAYTSTTSQKSCFASPKCWGCPVT